MKRITTILGAFFIASLVLTSCSDSGWSQKEKDAFMGTCVVPGVSSKSYCSCMLKKIEKKYPDPEDAKKLDMEWMMEEAGDCLE